MNAHGHGSGEIAADGSPVELYTALPENPGAAALIHAAVLAGASILELGAGTGRVTHPLPALGHPVVAADGSAATPTRIPGAETVGPASRTCAWSGRSTPSC